MKKNGTLSQRELSSLCMELSVLFHAGVSEADALTLLAEEETDPQLKSMLGSAALRMDDGAPLSAALREEGCFPAYVCGLLEVGERSGRTEEALRALSRYYEERARMERQIRNALLYPAVMLALMLVVIGVLLVRVLPIFDDVYATLGGRLTGVAGSLLALGQALDAAMPALCVLLVIIMVLVALFAGVPSFRAKAAGLWRSKLGDRGVFRQMNNAQLAQAMSMGMRSGLPAEEALSLAGGLMNDLPAAQARCLNCRARLDGGMGLSDAMKAEGLLGSAQCRLLELSQRSGAGDEAMERIAASLSEESQAALEEKVSRVEPMLVLVCSVLVGLILLSVMLPLMHIMTAIG